MIFRIFDRSFITEYAAKESYEILPASTMKLTPHTESLFKMTDDYPDRFFKWADRFIRITNNMKK